MIKKSILLSVCIATYKRKSLLENLLISITKQSLPPNFKTEIIVTDNDKNGSAREILNKFSNSDIFSFKYYIQPEQNISLTRNTCVKQATGEFICFIDDDETADSKWIYNLYSCLNEYNADAVFGYVEPVFDQKIKNHFKKRKFYFTPIENSGDKAKFYYTTNCIVRYDIIKSENGPFDPQYGLTGGEDVHLFERLSNRNANLICCKEAITYEFIPEERASYRYLFNRSLRGGQSYLRRTLEKKKNIIFRCVTCVKIIIKLILGVFLILIYPISKEKPIYGVIFVGDAIGKLRALFSKYKSLY